MAFSWSGAKLPVNMPFSLWHASQTKLRASCGSKSERQQSIRDVIRGVTLSFLTSLLGQVAPSLKHSACTLWVPKESMPAIAAMIEVVFILLVGLEGYSCFVLEYRSPWGFC